MAGQLICRCNQPFRIDWLVYCVYAGTSGLRVRTIGQVELLVTLAISILFFKEAPNRLEWIGMLILVVGVMALLMAP